MHEGGTDDWATRECVCGGRGVLECLLSFWLPQGLLQAVAFLKHQYREDERGREEGAGGG